MKKIFYVYRTARGTGLKSWRTGKEPDHVLYGLNHLRNLGYKVGFSDLSFNRCNLLALINILTQKLSVKFSSVGFRLDQAILLLPKLRHADVIITVSDSAGLPILLLKKLKLLKNPVVYISIGLINELAERKQSRWTKYYLSLLKEADRIVCHSRIERDLFIKHLPECDNKVLFLPFGIDQKYFSGRKYSGKFILTIGRDRSRDFQLLAKVASQIPNEKFVVITSRSNIKGLTFPENVTLYFDMPYFRVRKMYQEAKLVFLPLLEINRASGQISFLESLAANNIIVVSGIKGIKDVYRKTLLNPNVIVCKPGDLKSATESIRKALMMKRISKDFPKEFTSLAYSRHLANIIKKYE